MGGLTTEREAEAAIGLTRRSDFCKTPATAT
jgi:hypothetical protein